VLGSVPVLDASQMCHAWLTHMPKDHTCKTCPVKRIIDDALTELAGCAQGLAGKLGLHYHTTLLATHDASASMRPTATSRSGCRRS
jgi:hypothetical protein